MSQIASRLPRGAMLLVLFASFATASASVAQVQWTRIATANEPPPRARSGVAYDEVRDRIVLFGGLGDAPPSYTLGDTWLFDGANWSRAVTGSAPSPRQWSAAAYDRRRQRVVLFGGMEWTGNPFPWIVRADTWEWDGSAWSRRTPQTSPPARAMAGFAYDDARGRIVMFGGYAFVNTTTVINLNDTWEWDGTNWFQASPTVKPSVRADSKLFYDCVRQHVLMTGGVFDNGTGNSMFLTGTWEWDGSDWTRLGPSLDPIAAPAEMVVYDEARRRAVRYQGAAQGKVFEWDGTDWIQRTPVGASPQDRGDPNAVYDRERRRIVLFGGRLPFSVIGETWSYGPTSPADYRVFGSACGGSAGMPELSSTEFPWTDGLFSGQLTNVPQSAPTALYVGGSKTDYAGIPLPLDLAFLGAPGCTLLVSLDFGVRLTPATGAARWTLSVPDDAALRGQSFFMQGTILDPAANPFGVVFSDAAAATIGSR